MTTTATAAPSAASVREWGARNGWPVGKRGRLSHELFAAYADACESRAEPREAASEPAKPVDEPVCSNEPRVEPNGLALDMTYGAGQFALSLAGAEVFRDGLASECGKWARERGYAINERNPVDYQAISAYVARRR